MEFRYANHDGKCLATLEGEIESRDQARLAEVVSLLLDLDAYCYTVDISNAALSDSTSSGILSQFAAELGRHGSRVFHGREGAAGALSGGCIGVAPELHGHAEHTMALLEEKGRGD